MKKPDIPLNERERLLALKSYDILDTETEAIFDSITKLAAIICEVPICLISLVDENRQWFKSRQGLDATETPREISFCGHAINQTEVFYVKDATKDDRFKDNPLVTDLPNVIFYAGKPLIDNDGFAIGTLCVIDNKPRELTQTQLDQLKLLSEQIIYFVHAKINIKKKDLAYSLLTKVSSNLPGFIFCLKLFSNGKIALPYSSQNINGIFGIDSDEVQDDASKILALIHPEDYAQFTKSLSESALSMSNWTSDFRIIMPSNEEKWLHGSANPEKGKDDTTIWYGFINDISTQKKQEDSLYHSSRMATLGEMAAGIAHEINNPLAIIHTTSQLLTASIKRNNIDEEKLLNYSNKIASTTDRISKIIKSLSYFSNSPINAPFRNESIVVIVQNTISLCLEKFKISNIKFTVNYDIDIMKQEIECRAAEISQVLLNLLNNSFETISSLDNKFIQVDLKNNLKIVEIIVTDSGLRRDSNDLTNSIGISIGKGIIQAHGGRIIFDNECTNNRFIIELPKKF